MENMPTKTDRESFCPVTPQELRNAAAYCNRMNPGLAHKLRAAADWLEKPAPAFSSRCPHCDHAVHVGTCLQALRVGKPGEDVFCLCPASEPTRAAEVVCKCLCTENTSANFGGVRIDSTDCPLHGDAQPALPTAQARPVTREQVMNVIIGAPVWRRFGPGDAADRLTDEIMKLLEGR